MSASALTQLGVSTDLLSPEEKSFLDTNGYLNLGPILSPLALESIRNRISALISAEGEAAGKELRESVFVRNKVDEGAERLSDLVNKGPEFDVFYSHPRVLAAISHVLGSNIKLSSLNYRAAIPGAGLQKLHADYPEAVPEGDYRVCNSIWLLDDFSETNGATRIVPGTHLHQQLPQDVMENPMAPHPNEIILEAPAGSVVIFNSHVWHGGTTNRTAYPRRAIHSYFCRRDQPQQINQKSYIRPETLERISAAATELLAL
ncbi:MAG TPA: phytanoyl-CoA dioxygenase family protein [Lunatimonas sp.]|nr:phytanoyl-CoA dioxygenase family protein [Lunatimonas sp.]